jgi:signal transduction histidine kinase
MKTNNQITDKIFPILPWLVFAVFTIYTYGWFFEAPYLGFFYASSTGKVLFVTLKDPEASSLLVGDTITQINNIPVNEYYRDYAHPVFDGFSEGDLIPLTVIDQTGETRHIEWKYVGFTRAEFLERIYSGWWVNLIFFAAGTMAFFTVRPRDKIWRLFIAMNYLTAVWLIMGFGPSTYNLWGSLLILRIMVWISIPAYIELNWVFPKPFFDAPPRFKWLPETVLFILAATLGILGITGILPFQSYYHAFIITILLCFGLLILHYIFQKESRPSISLLLRFALISFTPLIITLFLNQILNVSTLSLGGATTFIIILPIGYYYAIFRHRLGNLEFRANQTISIVIYICLLVVIFTLLLSFLQIMFHLNQVFFAISLTAVLLAALSSLAFFNQFQRFVERRVLRIPFPTTDIVNTFNEQITTASSTNRLVDILRTHILPAMLIRQSALFMIDSRQHLTTIYADGLNPKDIPESTDRQVLIDNSQKYLWADRHLPDTLKWARLIVPLIFDQQVIGLWLFGKRDPDDFYSVNNIKQLQTLANQTGIALVNNQQAQNLRALYQANINQHEQERNSLARELHDDTLNSLTVLQRDVNDPALIQKTDQIIANLRKIVQGLRPGMLVYGLHTALEDLGDIFNERQQTTKVAVELNGTSVQFQQEFELHIYRIIQQACENALQHSGASNLLIHGEISEELVEILVEDDGCGIQLNSAYDLDSLLADGHYGLAGMLERASLINAKLFIAPGEESGTSIKLVWRNPKTD